MWGDEYIPPDPDPRIDTGSPWITAPGRQCAGPQRATPRHGGRVTPLGPREAITRAKIICALEKAGEASVRNLCQLTRLSDNTLYRHLSVLRAAGRAHISRWLPRTGHKPAEAIYRIGAGADAVNPAPRTTQDIAWMKPRKRRHRVESAGTLPDPRPLGIWGLAW